MKSTSSSHWIFTLLIFGYGILFGDEFHVEDIRPREVVGSNAALRYSASFDSSLELPDFALLPEGITRQFVELATAQKSGNIRSAVWDERKVFFSDCLVDARQYEDCGKEDFTDPRYYHATSGKLMFQNKRYLSYRLNYCHWTGCPCGAANEGETTNVVFDCQTGHRLIATDIVCTANKRKLHNLIRLKLSQQFKGDEFKSFATPDTRTDAEIVAVVAEARKGDIGTPWVSDNFCLTKDGLEWTFMPCEIASASYGTITVKIPWKDLRGIVKVELSCVSPDCQ